jgi:hypothetical protein
MKASMQYALCYIYPMNHTPNVPSLLLITNSINYEHTFYANNIEEYQYTTFIKIAMENETLTMMFVKHMHHNFEK